MSVQVNLSFSDELHKLITEAKGKESLQNFLERFLMAALKGEKL